MLLGMFVGAWLGTGILTGENAKPAAIGLGIVLIVYAVLGLSKVQIFGAATAEIWLGPMVGVVTGYVMAATGVFVIPALPYLQAIGLEKDELVQALGLHFTVSTVALALVLWDGGAFNVSLGTLSLFAIVPAMLGMYVGQHMRRASAWRRFRFCFMSACCCSGSIC